ncbi:hypothetical protein ACN2C7_15345 [Caulobacter sp. ErkDOM-E]|uniref:hypothetical protein n=1 Tax=Caulobacter sp. ErkDOM-E TaxID=3402778 RepID=UPI003AF46DC5
MARGTTQLNRGRLIDHFQLVVRDQSAGGRSSTPDLKKNLRVSCYHLGHMAYGDLAALKKMKADLDSFYAAAQKASPVARNDARP